MMYDRAVGMIRAMEEMRKIEPERAKAKTDVQVIVEELVPVIDALQYLDEAVGAVVVSTILATAARCTGHSQSVLALAVIQNTLQGIEQAMSGIPEFRKLQQKMPWLFE